MTHTLSFFAGTEYLGEIPAASSTFDIEGGFYRLYHTAFCCQCCGETWGRIVSSDPKAVWLFAPRACRACAPRWWDIVDAGQFTDPLPTGRGIPFSFTPRWPAPLLRWELTSLLSSIQGA